MQQGTQFNGESDFACTTKLKSFTEFLVKFWDSIFLIVAKGHNQTKFNNLRNEIQADFLFRTQFVRSEISPSYVK